MNSKSFDILTHPQPLKGRASALFPDYKPGM